jgi:hypothetical protein
MAKNAKTKSGRQIAQSRDAIRVQRGPLLTSEEYLLKKHVDFEGESEEQKNRVPHALIVDLIALPLFLQTNVGPTLLLELPFLWTEVCRFAHLPLTAMAALDLIPLEWCGTS